MGRPTRPPSLSSLLRRTRTHCAPCRPRSPAASSSPRPHKPSSAARAAPSRGSSPPARSRRARRASRHARPTRSRISPSPRHSPHPLCVPSLPDPGTRRPGRSWQLTPNPHFAPPVHRPHPPGLALLRPPAAVRHLVDARATPREPRAPHGGGAPRALVLPSSHRLALARLGRPARTLYRRRAVVVGSPGRRSERCRRGRLALGAEACRRPWAVALGPVSPSSPPSSFLLAFPSFVVLSLLCR